jgi:aspartyl-tRNA(Asn)/glutamyl-tRNA(Gln) amidotransferase subunit C
LPVNSPLQTGHLALIYLWFHLNTHHVTDIYRYRPHCQLARLELAPIESERMLTQMNSFFNIVEQMRAVDTTGIEPLAHPVVVLSDMALRLREDTVREPNQREANQKSAPAVENGLFLVPKVIE